jgi:hypothetical protein
LAWKTYRHHPSRSPITRYTRGCKSGDFGGHEIVPQISIFFKIIFIRGVDYHINSVSGDKYSKSNHTKTCELLSAVGKKAMNMKTITMDYDV